jgi:hypothetical protein
MESFKTVSLAAWISPRLFCMKFLNLIPLKPTGLILIHNA